MSRIHIKKGDNVLVLAGKDKGKTGVVLSTDAEKSRVVVDGVHILTHHNKPKSQTDKGGIVKAPGAISSSNVQVICPVCGKATRVAHSTIDGKKQRVCKKCAATLDIKIAVAKTEKKSKKVKAEAK